MKAWTGLPAPGYDFVSDSDSDSDSYIKLFR